MKETDGYSDEEEAVLLQLFRKVERTGMDGLTEAFLQIDRNFTHINFSEIERVLRRNHTEFGFIAIPTKDYKVLKDFIVVDPNDSTIERDYVAQPVWSRAEADMICESLGLNNDPLINTAKLTEAGVLHPIPGTDAARMVKGTYTNSN